MGRSAKRPRGSVSRKGNGAAYRRLWASVRSKGDPCWICGGEIDYSLPSGDPMSFSLDHYHPVSRWAEFGYATPGVCELDPDNARAAHLVHNQSRGNRMPGELVARERASLPAIESSVGL